MDIAPYALEDVKIVKKHLHDLQTFMDVRVELAN